MPLKLDIGCGGRGSRQEGFIGVDIHPRPAGKTGAEYYRLDFVTEPLPWQENTIDEIIALDMIEHLTPANAERLLQRAYGLLKPGARMTVTTCDLMMLCRKYVEHDQEFMSQKNLRGNKELWPGKCMADRLNYAIHQATHVWAYDQISLLNLAYRALPQKAQIESLPQDHQYNVMRAEHLPAGTEIGLLIIKEPRL